MADYVCRGTDEISICSEVSSTDVQIPPEFSTDKYAWVLRQLEVKIEDDPDLAVVEEISPGTIFMRKTQKGFPVLSKSCQTDESAVVELKIVGQQCFEVVKSLYCLRHEINTTEALRRQQIWAMAENSARKVYNGFANTVASSTVDFFERVRSLVMAFKKQVKEEVTILKRSRELRPKLDPGKVMQQLKTLLDWAERTLLLIRLYVDNAGNLDIFVQRVLEKINEANEMVKEGNVKGARSATYYCVRDCFKAVKSAYKRLETNKERLIQARDIQAKLDLEELEAQKKVKTLQDEVALLKLKTEALGEEESTVKIQLEYKRQENMESLARARADMDICLEITEKRAQQSRMQKGARAAAASRDLAGKAEPTSYDWPVYEEKKRRHTAPAEILRDAVEHKKQWFKPESGKEKKGPPEGSEKKGPDSTESEKKGPASMGFEKKGPASTGIEKKGPASKGSEKKGPASKGSEKKGPASTGSEKKGPASTGSEKKRPESTGSEKKGPDSTGSEKKGPDISEKKSESHDLKASKSQTALDRIFTVDTRRAVEKSSQKLKEYEEMRMSDWRKGRDEVMHLKRRSVGGSRELKGGPVHFKVEKTTMTTMSYTPDGKPRTWTPERTDGRTVQGSGQHESRLYKGQHETFETTSHGDKGSIDAKSGTGSGAIEGVVQPTAGTSEGSGSSDYTESSLSEPPTDEQLERLELAYRLKDEVEDMELYSWEQIDVLEFHIDWTKAAENEVADQNMRKTWAEVREKRGRLACNIRACMIRMSNLAQQDEQTLRNTLMKQISARQPRRDLEEDMRSDNKEQKTSGQTDEEDEFSRDTGTTTTERSFRSRQDF